MWWWRSGGVGAMGCGCAAPLLAHVNLLLTLLGGAALATAARLKWDPSTYIAVRELFPAEYRAAAVATTVAGSLLLLLPHTAAAALLAPRPRTARVLLYLYAGAMSLLVVGEVAFGAWLARRLLAWLASDAAQQLHEAMELREYLKPILQYFSRWHPLPQRIESLIQEAEEDGPRNMYVAGAAGLLLALLQPLAVLLALLAARHCSSAARACTTVANKTYSAWSVRRWRGASPRHFAARCATALHADGDGDAECARARARLRTAYKNGRIVVIAADA